jgi:hypothetical protein
MLGISVLMKHRTSSWASFQIWFLVFAPLICENKEMLNFDPGELQYGRERVEKSGWLSPAGPSCSGLKFLGHQFRDTWPEKSIPKP